MAESDLYLGFAFGVLAVGLVISFAGLLLVVQELAYVA